MPLPTAPSVTPEGLNVAEAYLQCNDIALVAQELNLTTFQVTDILQTREVKQYVDTMYLQAGYRNRTKIAEALDTIIDLKMAELEESEMGSNKDIADLLMMAHKLRMEEIAAMTKANASVINKQTNVQIITDQGGVNYQSLLTKILN